LIHLVTLPVHLPSVASVSGVSEGVKADDCDLCEAAKITHWFHEDDVCWIAECEICDTPMVVWRWHGVEPGETALAHMHAQLARVAGDVFDGHYVDDNMRNIPDHYHAHARPAGGFFGHGHRKDRGR
jgi:hypothetical protein